jgi:hypothetical protein
MPINASSSNFNSVPLDLLAVYLKNQMSGLAKGNWGASNALKDVVNNNDLFLASQVFDALEEQNVRGPDIWKRYSDKCDRNAQKFVTMTLEIKANQMQSHSKNESTRDEILTSQSTKSPDLSPSTVQDALQKPYKRNG